MSLDRAALLRPFRRRDRVLGRSTSHWWVGLGLLLGLLPTASVQGQDRFFDEPVFTTYGMEAGLSQGTVNALIQDESGLLWVGTQDGLNRFDGVGFKAFKHERDDSTSLSDDFVLALVEAGEGRIWVGTQRGGLNLFDPLTGQARRFELPELGPWLIDPQTTGTEREGRAVHGILLLEDGALLLSTDVGLARFDPSAGTASVVSAGPSAGWTADVPPVLCQLAEGGGFVGLPDGSVRRVSADLNLELGVLLPDPVTALRCPGDGPGLAATRRGVVFSLGRDMASVELLGDLQGELGQSVLVQDVLEDAAHRLWIATAQGLFIRHPGGAARRIGAANRDRGLPSDEASRLLIDDSGVIWVGTWNGLSGVHPRSLVIRRVLRRTDGESGLSGNGVVSIESTGDDGLWIGTMEGGVDRIDAGWRDGPPAISRPPSLREWPSVRVFGLERGHEGDLWAATVGDGLLHLTLGASAAVSVPVVPSDPRRLAYSVVEDRDGTVWAGTEHAGLVRYNPSLGRFEEYHGPDGDWDFGSSYVWPIVEDAQGRLWVGAFNGGLTSIDAERQRHQRYEAGPGGLSDDRVLSLFAGSGGFIWIGTQGGGLNRLDPESGEIRVYTTDDGLPHDHVEGIIEDDAGYLWVTTNDGLARLDPDAEDFWVLKEGAGLAGNRFFANAVHKNDRGELFFGGPNGLTILDPARVAPMDRPPPVVLTGFQIQGRDAPLARALATLGLDLEPDEDFFSFEFAALDFTDPTQNRYRYRLEGLDDEWIEAGASRVANYTSVPPAQYVFRVAARSADGVWNEEGLAIPLLVQTPYHQTVWFRSLVVAAVLLLISGFYSYRLHEMHKRQNLRLRIAGGLHDDIGANLSAIALRSDLVSRAPSLDDKRRRQLGEMGMLARETALKVRETVWTVNTRYDTISGLVGKMRDTADMMLGGNVPFELEGPDPESIEDRIIQMELRQNVYLLYKESLHNALKHSGAASVAIVIAYEAPNFTFRVTDDGKGFDPAAHASGSGLALMEKRAEQHGGKLTIQTAPGSGTTVELRMRLR